MLKQAGVAWIDDYAPSMGAALAYYTMFSLAPLLLLVISIAGLVFGADAARGQIVSQLGGLIGEEGAVAVQGLLKSASHPAQSLATSIIGIVTLVIGATSIFGELQSDLDRIWRAPVGRASAGIRGLLRTRLLVAGTRRLDRLSAARVAGGERRAVRARHVVGMRGSAAGRPFFRS